MKIYLRIVVATFLTTASVNAVTIIDPILLDETNFFRFLPPKAIVVPGEFDLTEGPPGSGRTSDTVIFLPNLLVSTAQLFSDNSDATDPVRDPADVGIFHLVTVTPIAVEEPRHGPAMYQPISGGFGYYSYTDPLGNVHHPLYIISSDPFPDNTSVFPDGGSTLTLLGIAAVGLLGAHRAMVKRSSVKLGETSSVGSPP